MTAVAPVFAGETICCVATGPSLRPDDVAHAAVRARLLVVNDAMVRWPTAAVGYSSDLGWIRYYKGVPQFVGLKYTIEACRGRGDRDHRAWPGWTVLRNTGEQGIETDPTGLRTARNSGGAAINLAVHLGARRIVLLGYDCGGRGHFFGEHPRALRRSSPFDAFRRNFDLMVPVLDRLQVEVINCSRTTAITAFPRRPIAEVLL